MAGRKPKPTALHALHGTLNATRHASRKHEPEAVGDLLQEPPSWMSDGQQAGWRYAVEHAPRGVLKMIDRGVLAIWVEAEDRHRTAVAVQASLDAKTKLPLLLKGKDGSVGISPYVTILNRTALVMLKAGSELGFSPASRPRLAGGDEKPGQPAASSDPWDRLRLLQGGLASGEG